MNAEDKMNRAILIVIAVFLTTGFAVFAFLGWFFVSIANYF